ncbi:MAG: hypothetical protein R6W79_04575, partial [Acidimicrobiia bacterium]
HPSPQRVITCGWHHGGSPRTSETTPSRRRASPPPHSQHPAIPIPGQPGDYVLEMSGCCECGGGLALLRDGIVSEVRGEPPWCQPQVITRWGDGWLIVDSATDDGTYRPSLIAVDEDLRNAFVLVGIEAGCGGWVFAYPSR